jgi:hypothetical protein
VQLFDQEYSSNYSTVAPVAGLASSFKQACLKQISAVHPKPVHLHVSDSELTLQHCLFHGSVLQMVGVFDGVRGPLFPAALSAEIYF